MYLFYSCFWREDLHKVDAMEFAQQRAAACLSGGGLQDRSSAALLWNLLILLCRQNGVGWPCLVIGILHIESCLFWCNHHSMCIVSANSWLRHCRAAGAGLKFRRQLQDWHPHPHRLQWGHGSSWSPLPLRRRPAHRRQQQPELWGLWGGSAGLHPAAAGREEEGVSIALHSSQGYPALCYFTIVKVPMSQCKNIPFKSHL